MNERFRIYKLLTAKTTEGKSKRPKKSNTEILPNIFLQVVKDLHVFVLYDVVIRFYPKELVEVGWTEWNRVQQFFFND